MSGRFQKQTEPFVLLDDNLSGGGSVLFVDPSDIISCSDPAQIREAFAQMEAERAAGKHLAGFLSYELGYCLEEKLTPLMPPTEMGDVPLMWFGVFDQAMSLTPLQTSEFLARQRSGEYQLADLTPSMARGPYCEMIDTVRDYIAAGDTYQVNYTFKHEFQLSGSPAALFQELRQRQNVSMGAYIETGRHSILSLSPEIFLTTSGHSMRTRPMKGTARRGQTQQEDTANRVWLTKDAKSRAENLMIVDLLRNDMSKVCTAGSVQVTELFTVETYQSLHQMTSNIIGTLQDGVTPSHLIQQLFPCGSITGAPKVRTMEIIQELEQGPRGVYTGSIGHIAPNGDCRFNVAIRTLVIDAEGRGEMGIGSGIVYDSDPAAEYEECLLKGQFLSGNISGYDKPAFDLIETLRWQKETGIYLLGEHLDRLSHSAGFFGYHYDRQEIEEKLAALSYTSIQRVRLLLHADGSTTITSVPIAANDIARPITFVLSDKTVDSSNIFLRHKTTHRAFFEDELALQTKKTGCGEVLFVNERGELTEGARTNFFLEKKGVLYTPPLNCGVLNGTLRTRLLNENYKGLTEKILTPEDLKKADAVYFGNSVRDLMQAQDVHA